MSSSSNAVEIIQPTQVEGPTQDEGPTQVEGPTPDVVQSAATEKIHWSEGKKVRIKIRLILGKSQFLVKSFSFNQLSI